MDIPLILKEEMYTSLRKFADELTKQFPNVKTQAWHGWLSPHTCQVAVSSLIPDPLPNTPDEVVLEITASHVQTSPELEALLIWGHPGNIEIDLFPDRVKPDGETLAVLRRQLPTLKDKFVASIRRGAPSAPPPTGSA